MVNAIPAYSLTGGDSKLRIPLHVCPLLSVYYSDYEDHSWALRWLLEYDL